MNRVTCPFCGLINFASANFCKKCHRELAAGQITGKGKTGTHPPPTTLGKIVFKNKLSVMAKVVLFFSIGFTILTLVAGLFYRHLVKEGEFALVAIFFGVIPFFCGLGVVQLMTQKKINVYENGFVYQNKKDVSTVFWSEIKSCVESVEWVFVEGIPAGRGRSLKILTFSNEEFVLNQEVGGLGQMIGFIKNKATSSSYQKKSKVNVINN